MRTLEICAVALYNLVILAGAAYLIQVNNWSPWWFLVAMCCCGSFSEARKK